MSYTTDSHGAKHYIFTSPGPLAGTFAQLGCKRTKLQVLLNETTNAVRNVADDLVTDHELVLRENTIHASDLGAHTAAIRWHRK